MAEKVFAISGRIDRIGKCSGFFIPKSIDANATEFAGDG